MPVKQKNHSYQTIEKKLDRKLLAFGGDKVIHPERDPHASQLVASGQLFDLPIVKRPGKRNRCHSNAAGLWGKNVDNHRLVTGYYLIEGLWRSHSWVVDDKQQYETTVLAEKYFGVVLEPDEALHFWFATYLPEKYPGPMWLMNDLNRREN